ncbi:MAG: UbiA family prenyltransferase [Thermoplasmatota archaeon]
MIGKKDKQMFLSFFGLIRPFTLLAPFTVSLSIMVASFYYHGGEFSIDIFFQIILPACVSLSLLNGASNALNQATDHKSDGISKPYRPIPQGKISVKNAYVISLLLYGLSFFMAFIIHSTFFVFVLIITFFTVSYSVPPRMKDKLVFNQLWIAIPRGFLGILASWSVFGSVLNPLPLIIAAVAALFLFGGCITKDITDCNADKQCGTKTLVNRYGIEKAAFLSLPFLFFPFLLIPLAINFGFLKPVFWFLTFLAIPGIYIFKLMIVKQKPSRFFENTQAWSLMYLTYFIFASSFSMLTILSVVV